MSTKIAPSWDHPRVRGEHRFAATYPGDDEGSSPRARGALIREAVGGRDAGIIPACAGSTGSERRHGGLFGDHPRVRGEHLTRSRVFLSGRGSSPRARGARSAWVLLVA